MSTATVLARQKRKKRIAAKVRGTAKKPRLSVYRSRYNIFAQLMDDTQQKTLMSASSLDKSLKGKLKSGANIEAAKAVGKLLAEKAVKKGIKEVVFDRSGYLYHGRVKALAEAAREAGLKF